MERIEVRLADFHSVLAQDREGHREMEHEIRHTEKRQIFPPRLVKLRKSGTMLDTAGLGTFERLGHQRQQLVIGKGNPRLQAAGIHAEVREIRHGLTDQRKRTSERKPCSRRELFGAGQHVGRQTGCKNCIVATNSAQQTPRTAKIVPEYRH